MPGKQAKILSDQRNPERNRVLVLLSLKAGLRASEIANLTWDMVVGPTNEVGLLLELHDKAAKRRSGRRVPLHPDLRAALINWQRKTTIPVGPVITSERGSRMTAVSIVNWFARAYRCIGVQGCSSHSGRRTFITRAARLVHNAGGSLRNVQLLAGHSSIQTTQRYIDGDTDAQHKLVSMIRRGRICSERPVEAPPANRPNPTALHRELLGNSFSY
jgi:integrase